MPTKEDSDEPSWSPEADVERYEQLRRRALGGEPSGWRLGLGVVCHRGVAAWLRVWRSTVAPEIVTPQPAAISAGSDELVGVLATMALFAIGG